LNVLIFFCPVPLDGADNLAEETQEREEDEQVPEPRHVVGPVECAGRAWGRHHHLTRGVFTKSRHGYCRKDESYNLAACDEPDDAIQLGLTERTQDDGAVTKPTEQGKSRAQHEQDLGRHQPALFRRLPDIAGAVDDAHLPQPLVGVVVWVLEDSLQDPVGRSERDALGHEGHHHAHGRQQQQAVVCAQTHGFSGVGCKTGRCAQLKLRGAMSGGPYIGVSV